MADVLLYLVQLADKPGIDLLAAAQDKMRLNAETYPGEAARAVTGKYTAL